MFECTTDVDIDITDDTNAWDSELPNTLDNICDDNVLNAVWPNTIGCFFCDVSGTSTEFTKDVVAWYEITHDHCVGDSIDTEDGNRLDRHSVITTPKNSTWTQTNNLSNIVIIKVKFNFCISNAKQYNDHISIFKVRVVAA